MEWLYYLDILCNKLTQSIYVQRNSTNGIQGFVRHIFSAIKEIEPTHVAVCWDMGQETFRNEMYDGYKQNRPAPPDELIPQFDYVKEISHQFGFVNVGKRNYEADDIIGSLAETYSQEHEVYIITGDRDLLQCINHNVEVWLIKKVLQYINVTRLIVLLMNMD